jgi:type VI secretion system secreted protein VgrG
MNMLSMIGLPSNLTESNRPIRLRLSHQNAVLDDVLLVKHVSGQETLCGGIEYRLLCVSTQAALPLKDFIALPVELQFVTDRGQLRSVCGIVAQASAGQSDGGLATYQLVVRHALALMEQRFNTRIFRDMNVVDITAAFVREWRDINPILAKTFDIDTSGIFETYSSREFTKQHNESDSAFLRRSWKREGIGWFMRPGQVGESDSSATPAHTLVLFDAPNSLAQNAAGTVRFHRDAGTEARDGVINWSAVRSLSAGGITRQTWNHMQGRMMSTQLPGTTQQGEAGNQFAFSLDDYLIDAPHVDGDGNEYRRLGELRIRRHEYEAKCFHGESGVRDLCVGQWFRLDDHPDIDTHPNDEREFVLTELSVAAENNLPKDIDERAQRLFSANGWQQTVQAALEQASNTRDVKYTNRFTCVRRGIPIVPAYDPRTDLPRVQLQSAIVVGPPGEEVYCDELGRIKLRFPGTREQDHPGGVGASNTDRDSAWVRVATNWASDRWGSINLPRVGDEVLVDFLGGDPDKPIVVGRVFSGRATPPSFSSIGAASCLIPFMAACICAIVFLVRTAIIGRRKGPKSYEVHGAGSAQTRSNASSIGYRMDSRVCMPRRRPNRGPAWPRNTSWPRLATGFAAVRATNGKPRATGYFVAHGVLTCAHDALRLSIDQMHEVARQRGGRCLSEHYVNSVTKLHWECHRGHQWHARPGAVTKGHWCAACAHLNRITNPHSKARSKYVTD